MALIKGRKSQPTNVSLVLGNMIRQRHMLSRRHTTYHQLPENLLVVIPHKHNILGQAQQNYESVCDTSGPQMCVFPPAHQHKNVVCPSQAIAH